MLRIDARCCVRLPPKVTLKNYSSVGPFVVRKKVRYSIMKEKDQRSLSNSEIKRYTKTLINCPCQNYDV